MVKKLKYLLFIIPFLFILNVQADEIVDMSTWTYVSGRINSDNTMEYNDQKVFNDYYFLNPYNVFSGVEFSSGSDYFIRSSFWERTHTVWSPCNQASFTINFHVLFNDKHDYVNHVKQIRFNNSVCDITARDSNEGKVYASCVVPYNSGTFNDIFIDYNEFFTYPSSTSSIYISRYNRLTCALDTQSLITNDNANTQNIINNNTQNSQNIINNQNQNSQNIINNQNQNTQDIIDNQNANNQQQIESQQVCKTLVLDKNSISINDSYLDSVGYSVTSQWSIGWGITDFIEVTHVKKLSTYGSAPSLCFYNEVKSLISCSNNENLSVGDVSLPSGTKYIRASINVIQDKPQYDIQLCLNGNQALSDGINDLNDTLNSESTPNTNQDIEDMEDILASDTPITDLITMPLTLIHAYINGINASCSPVNLGSLYGSNLTIPCLNLEQKLGSDLWSKIDVLFSIFMCYNIGMLFITAFSGITSLRDDFDSLYVPKHADTGYQPKHGGGS